VLACNTASVRALDVLRRELEPALPVVGTVPAIKPAAGTGGPAAIWATIATTGSPYQRDLIRQFARGVKVTEVACPGLADAIEAADRDAIDAAIGAAAFLTPPEVRSVVLGCTQYELAMDRIRSVLPRIRLHGSAAAVAAQALRRRVTRPGGSGDAGSRGLAASRHAQAARSGAQRHARAGLAVGGHHAESPSAAADVAWPGGPADAPDAPDSAAAVTGRPAAAGRHCAEHRAPDLWVLLSGRPADLPAAALHYAEGRLLAGVRLPSPAA
jgi:glutamate racemase